jgi:hypothetical protein
MRLDIDVYHIHVDINNIHINTHRRGEGVLAHLIVADGAVSICIY